MAAQYYPTTVIVGSTGASGQTGYAAAVTAQQTAVQAAVVAAQGATGVILQGITVSPAQLIIDTFANFYRLQQTVTYTAYY